ncbi:TorA maturation chaperone TorD [Mesocricetibacter intestinalis]|uniref:Probable Tat proofreading chaperone DmsD n=1 Tax=Mesocricetibacter intestinalis TaxID=1521930 RepID=A0A4R6VA68_9PAST|nr:Tat proofreading chaperone DmsD [Mesocricetibacter intestinalis]TDQ56655.1 TorA maturation chaperone TorD [Mesocricetibacter intestinalis]
MNEELLARISAAARFLGALFYYPPESPQLRPLLDFLQQEQWPQNWGEVKDAELLKAKFRVTENLDEQYQRLFIGPNSLAAPPWGSVYLDPESVIFGDSLLELRAFMQRHQIRFQYDEREPEDHIGLMLMFAAYLAENHSQLLAEFLGGHLLTWSERYLQLLAQQQDCPFYQGLALLTEQTLSDWRRRLNIEVEKVRLYR